LIDIDLGILHLCDQGSNERAGGRRTRARVMSSSFHEGFAEAGTSNGRALQRTKIGSKDYLDLSHYPLHEPEFSVYTTSGSDRLSLEASPNQEITA